ncbi:LAME_0H06986g1_1 [Lachancea meyersii CBS 8951]|uniref:Tyrosine--tRNA ligase n=1 Tax=Lachancea meyersii CBS 8951 TaxID=1266667 RepID=A0A1G4KEN2_9SACH|nr:LAME_0H06986g1_1 [Lachancea meyersii CBS 8951]
MLKNASVKMFFPRSLASTNGLRLFQRSIGSVNVLQTLRNRGLLAQVSEPESLLEQKLLNGDKIGLYCGADPTAKSLHLGNLLPLMVLLHFYIAGHDVYTVVGGATGQVGDPSGRSTERVALENSERLSNISKIQLQLRSFFERGLEYYNYKHKETSAKIGRAIHTNNNNWWSDMKMLDFLAMYGRHIRVNTMLSRDSVSSRLDGKDGIGFNEFTYQILQAYDFYHLNKTCDVTVQVGGNDQWGNITAGIDLIGRIGTKSKKEDHAFGLTVPLLTTSTGEKFGKSAGNAVFIDPQITTPFEMYQYFMRTTDEDVGKLLRTFTLLSNDFIEETIHSGSQNPKERSAQKLLAREVVDLVHGVGRGQDAETISEVLYGTRKLELRASDILRTFQDAGILIRCDRGLPLDQIIVHATGCSKSAARRKLKQGSIYIGPERTKVLEYSVDLESFYIDDRVLILRTGKQTCYVIEIN